MVGDHSLTLLGVPHMVDKTLVAVMVNAFTPEPTAEKLQARFRAAAQLAEQAEPGSLEHVIGDIHTLFSYHQGLDYRRMPSVVKWVEDAVKAAQSTARAEQETP